MMRDFEYEDLCKEKSEKNDLEILGLVEHNVFKDRIEELKFLSYILYLLRKLSIEFSNSKSYCFDGQILEMLRDNRRIDAIKTYKNRYGGTTLEARDAIDIMEIERL